MHIDNHTQYSNKHAYFGSKIFAGALRYYLAVWLQGIVTKQRKKTYIHTYIHTYNTLNTLKHNLAYPRILESKKYTYIHTYIHTHT